MRVQQSLLVLLAAAFAAFGANELAGNEEKVQGLSAEECQKISEPADAAACWSRTGRVLEFQGRFQESATALEHAVQLLQGNRPGTDTELSMAQNDLAVVYRHLGRLKEAEKLLRRITDGQRPESAALATAFNNLAQVLAQQGRVKQAKAAYEIAIQMWERTLSPDHPEVAAGLGNYGMFLLGQRDYSRARDLLRRAIEIDEQHFEPNDPRLARDLANASSLAVTQKRYTEAESMLRRALQILEEKLPGGHPEIAQVRANLTDVLKLQKKLKESSKAGGKSPRSV